MYTAGLPGYAVFLAVFLVVSSHHFGHLFVQLEILFTAAAVRVVCIQLSACPVGLKLILLLHNKDSFQPNKCFL